MSKSNKDKPFWTKEYGYDISVFFTLFGNDCFNVLPVIQIDSSHIEFAWLKGYLMICDGKIWKFN